MTSMAWYPLPQSGGTVSAGDEFSENQSTGWSLWSFSTSDDHNTTGGANSDRDNDDAQCSTDPSEEQYEGPAPLEEPHFTQPTEEIFMGQFSDEEMRRMDAPFEALDMFPDSMHRLLSYENMLSGVLTGSEDQDAKLDHNGIDTMDTCGFPLFSHDLQNAPRNAEPGSPKILADPPSALIEAGLKRRRAITGTEDAPGFEALVLEELEDVVFQLTKRTRICYRDAFYRLAESSKGKCSAANNGATTAVGSSKRSFQKPECDASRVSTPGCCPERETNAIDRTVADLALKPPCSASQLHGSCCADDSGAEAQSTVRWTTTA